MNKLKLIVVLLFAILGVFIFVGVSKHRATNRCTFFPQDKQRSRALLPRDFFIAHAGGAINGQQYTNSLEAITNSVKNGYKFIELDLMLTQDGKVVAGHGWENFNKITGHPELGDKALTIAEFEKRKIYGKYTPVSFIDINRIFVNNQELVLVVDKIDDFKKIVLCLPFIDRIIVETFGLSEYRRALAEGIKFPMLSLGKKDLINIDSIISGNISMVATPAVFLDAYREQFHKLNSKQICVFAFSTNDEHFIREKLVSKLATAFYVDFWDIKRSNCGAKITQCITY